MSVEAEVGYQVPFVIYEEQRPGLPEEFDLPDGLRGLRTGPIFGSTYRHPSEDWIWGPPRGPDRSAALAAIFIYDPKAGEVIVERVSRSEEYFRERERIQKEGWKPVPSGLDRVVGYKTRNH